MKSYNSFLVFALALLLYSFLVLGELVDVHLHDTYYVVPTVFFIWGFSFYFIVLWILYRLTSRFLSSNVLSWIYVGFTLISAAVMTSVVTLLTEEYSVKNLVAYSPETFTRRFEFQNIVTKLFIWSGAVFIIIQIMYISHVVTGMFFRKGK